MGTHASPICPDDPETVEDANAHPKVFAGKSVGDIADHADAVIAALIASPANRHRAVALTCEQFRYGFGNAVSEEEVCTCVAAGRRHQPH